jgi:PleD family two-component response regulator
MSELDDLEPKALPEAMAEARILVVDDNPSNLAVLAELLAEAGFRCVDVESSPENMPVNLSQQQAGPGYVPYRH